MLNLKGKAIAVGIIVVAFLVGHVYGQWVGYGKGEAAEREKLAAAKADNQVVIDQEAKRDARIEQKLDTFLQRVPQSTIQYVETRGSDPECLDAGGLHLIERNRQRARALADSMP